ncbi:MAG: DUF6174 domain-containing protein, partial [Anaerolineae bacterium]|nr:DUF6174 domain-containing protein [Anaerolineae bacterium]
ICFLSGVSVEFFLPQRLAQAKSLWASQNIENYRMTITVSRYHTYFTDFVIEVQQNRVVKASSRPTLFRNDPFQSIDNIQEYELDKSYLQVLPTRLSEYTLNNLFDVIDSSLGNLSSFHVSNCGKNNYRAEYDPALGYIKMFAIDEDNPYAYSYLMSWIPLFGCAKFHAVGEGFKITNFEVLPSS